VTSATEPPAPRTRPKNRRAITISAATELFYRRGYQRVSVADIARATNVGSSAIFRHFPTKSELLVACIRSGLSPILEIVAAATRSEGAAADVLGAVLEDLAEFALEHRAIGVLWQREARGLSETDQRMLRDEFRTISRALASVIRLGRRDATEAQADLLAWCSLGALVSVGFHSLELPHDDYVRFLVALVTELVSIELPEFAEGKSADVRVAPPPASRRDDLLNQATELFAERGFDTVAVDEIGSAAGIAGPSIYSHFDSKQKLLLAVIDRGNTALKSEAAAAVAAPDSADVKLGRLVDSYVGIAIRDRFLVRIVLSEVSQLGDADREFARREQREYIDTWTELLLLCRDESGVVARIRVQAVLLVISDAVQTPHLRVHGGFEASLRRIALSLLWST
jgi:AcrR family transcriptional regulator